MMRMLTEDVEGIDRLAPQARCAGDCFQRIDEFEPKGLRRTATFEQRINSGLFFRLVYFLTRKGDNLGEPVFQ